MKSKSVKKITLAIFAFLLISFAAVIIIYPERYVKVCFDGILLWGECVLPSLFPFMVITMLLIKTGVAEKGSTPFKRLAKSLHMPKVGATMFLMSICSGYPAGSRIVAEYAEAKAITLQDAKKLSLLCSTSGPLFIVGSVGYKMFGDKIIGCKIMLAHALSVIALGLIYALSSKKEKCAEPPPFKAAGNPLYDSFYSAVLSVLVAGGFICFFYTLSQVIKDFNLFYPLQILFTKALGEECSAAFCQGLVEVTGGCAALAQCGGKLSVPAAGFLITFGGACILAQQLCYLVKCNVRPTFFIFFKLLQALLCFAILLLIT
jgi:sporulation integral membrane protein YlbJ